MFLLGVFDRVFSQFLHARDSSNEGKNASLISGRVVDYFTLHLPIVVVRMKLLAIQAKWFS